MDFNKLIPDFGAFGRTDWANPCIKKNDKNWLISAILVALMLVFVFLPWCSVSATSMGITAAGSRLGIGTWYGFIGFITVIIALYGVLYEQKQFTFCGSVLAILMGIIGMCVLPKITVVSPFGTMKVDAEWIKDYEATVSHIGAILFMLASAGSAAWSFLQIKNEK